MTTRAVGIDLGTTFSAIAHVNKHGVPEILHNGEGDRITPTVILFEDQEVVVGNYAKQSAVVYPERVAEFVKRRMGERGWRFSYNGKDYTPEQISSVVGAVNMSVRACQAGQMCCTKAWRERGVNEVNH